jgi:hypothetical protein
MRMRLKTATLLCLLLGAGPALAQEPAGALPPCEPYVAAADAFNPDGDLDLRVASLAKMESAPDTLEAQWMYGLGALYRLGRDHPAGLVDQDLAKARRFYEQASLDGHIEALASLAELELAAGQPMQAMLWAQVYVKAKRISGRGRGLGYPAYLLKRVSARLPPGSGAEQDRQLALFMRNQGEKFRARLARPKAEDATPDCRTVEDDWPTSLANRAQVSLPKGRSALALDAATSGFALFSLTVDPDGRIAEVRVIDSVPTGWMAVQMDTLVREMQFNPVDPSAPQRRVLMPLSLDRGEARLLD